MSSIALPIEIVVYMLKAPHYVHPNFVLVSWATLQCCLLMQALCAASSLRYFMPYTHSVTQVKETHPFVESDDYILSPFYCHLMRSSTTMDSYHPHLIISIIIQISYIHVPCTGQVPSPCFTFYEALGLIQLVSQYTFI